MQMVGLACIVLDVMFVLAEFIERLKSRILDSMYPFSFLSTVHKHNLQI